MRARVHTGRASRRRREYLCANAVEEARPILMPQARWFSQFLTISVWFSIEASHPLRFVSASSLSFLPRRFCRQLSFCLPFLYLLSLALGLASILSAGCRGVVLGFSPPVPVETMRVRFHNIEQSFISGFEGRDACGEGKQNVRQLLNVAGAAPCWVDFAGVVIEDNWEQSPREERSHWAPSAHVCMYAICVAVPSCVCVW